MILGEEIGEIERSDNREIIVADYEDTLAFEESSTGSCGRLERHFDDLIGEERR